MSRPLLWLTEADVVSLLSLEEALEPLAAGLKRLAAGEGASVPKAMHAWAGGSVHALGAYDKASGLAGFKTWANTPAGASAVLVLFDAEAGGLRAVIEAGVLGALRTAGATALATRVLADSGADEVAVLGSGRQALLQLAAVALARPPRRVRVWSPTPEKRDTFAQRARGLFGLEVEAVQTVRAATQGAGVITSVTRAREPFLALEDIDIGAHLNAVGAILPGFAELEPGVLEASAVLALDDPEALRRNGREVVDALAAAPALAGRIVSLPHLLSWAPSVAVGRLTVFKSIGLGASDLALGAEVLRRAEAKGAGSPIDPPSPIPPRWRAS